jgi:uncharacterized protein YbbK (DUF523 family)
METLVGISACLLGERVRYDGGHKHEPALIDLLSRMVRFVPVCPEVEIGLGVPREPIQIVRKRGRLCLVGVQSGRDHTRAMKTYAERRARELGGLGLSGYVLKSASPSCGMEGVAVHTDDGRTVAARGFFAAELTRQLDFMPIEEEERLREPSVRETFIERVLAHSRLHLLLDRRWSLADLRRFHRRERTSLLARDPFALRRLDRLLQNRHRMRRTEIADRYRREFMRALAKPSPNAL